MASLDTGARCWGLSIQRPPGGIDHDRDERRAPAREAEGHLEPAEPVGGDVPGGVDDEEME
eukprot:3774669-Pyramimonas_sp.AAC.1